MQSSISTNKWYGFNVLWLFSRARKENLVPQDIVINERELDFMCKMGCTFVRVPTDYRIWIRDFKYNEPDEAMLRRVEDCVHAVVSRGMHCSLNAHRAPGYCINGNNLEKHNLWQDIEAQDAFVAEWTDFAKRFSSYSSEQLSFDLLNEPPNINQYGMTRDIHKAVITRVVNAIRAISPERPLIIDGLCGGNVAMPELADLGVIHSTRGYQPMAVTHYKANWCEETRGIEEPVYPGTNWAGKTWSKDTLFEHYAPWKELADAGVAVHVGEFGCYDSVNNKTALKWFEDLFDVYKKLGWGYALWNFEGAFGIAGHNRPDTRWEIIDGYRIDRDLYELFKAGMNFSC